jgi:hypothetical protein
VLGRIHAVDRRLQRLLAASQSIVGGAWGLSEEVGDVYATFEYDSHLVHRGQW